MSHVIVCHGNSITRGAFSTYDPIYAYPQQLQKFLTSQYPGEYTVFNAGTDGIRLPAMLSEFSAVVNVRAGAGQNIVIMQELGNTLQTPKTAQQVIDDALAYCAAAQAAGWTVYICTATPRATWGADQTTLNTINAYVRANFLQFGSRLIDLALVSELTTPTNLTYYDADGTHLKNAGFTSMALAVLDGVAPGGKARQAQDTVDYKSFLARLMIGAVSGTALAITRPVPGGPLVFTLT
jgi:hypothetical protein